MAWLAVDKDDTEYLFELKPKRLHDIKVWEAMDVKWKELPKGSIFRLIGKELTWNNEPVEI